MSEILPGHEDEPRFDLSSPVVQAAIIQAAATLVQQVDETKLDVGGDKMHRKTLLVVKMANQIRDYLILDQQDRLPTS